MTGILLRVKRSGSWENLDISSLTDDEIKAAMAGRSAEELTRWVVALVPRPFNSAGKTEHQVFAASLNAETIVGMQQALRDEEARVAKAHQAIRDLLKSLEDSENDAERFLIQPDPGCRVCTVGVTPDRYHTGPCARHRAEAMVKP